MRLPQLLNFVIAHALAERLVHQLTVCFLFADIVTVNRKIERPRAGLFGISSVRAINTVGIGRMDTSGKNLRAVGNKTPVRLFHCAGFEGAQDIGTAAGLSHESAKFQSPAIRGGRYFCFCAEVPYLSIDMPPKHTPVR